MSDVQAASGAGPWPGPQRLVELDALRGFALLGILLVNILDFSGIRALDVDHEGLDHIVLGILKFFAQGKFLSLFAILFGISFTLQLASLERQGVGIYPSYWRRLGALFLIGMLHTGLDPAEVLAVYALCGAVLVLFRKAPGPVVLVIALLLMGMPYLHTAIVTPIYVAQPAAESAPPEPIPEAALTDEGQAAVEDVTGSGEPAAPGEEEEMHAWNPYLGPLAIRLHSTGTLAEVMSYNHRFTVRRWTGSWVAYLWMTVPLPLMMIGLLIGRSGVLNRIDREKPLLKRMFWFGLAAGIVAGWLAFHLFDRAAQFGWNPWVWFPASWLFGLSGLVMALAYAAGLLLLKEWKVNDWLQGTLAPVGRLALTNYLLQTVICVSLFQAHGLGWYGKVSPSQAVFIALVVFAVQVTYSRMWLATFRYGPAEWLWRMVTYWRWLPLKAEVKRTTAAAP